eukprot:355222-Chlamydomonas_euryale.AAC.3
MERCVHPVARGTTLGPPHAAAFTHVAEAVRRQSDMPPQPPPLRPSLFIPTPHPHPAAAAVTAVRRQSAKPTLPPPASKLVSSHTHTQPPMPLPSLRQVSLLRRETCALRADSERLAESAVPREELVAATGALRAAAGVHGSARGVAAQLAAVAPQLAKLVGEIKAAEGRRVNGQWEGACMEAGSKSKW